MLAAGVALIWFLASLINGISAFGGNMVALPFITLFMDAKQAILLGCLSCVSMLFIIAVVFFKQLPKMEFALIEASSLAGTLIGNMLLLGLPSRMLMAVMGCILTSFLVWQHVQRHARMAVGISPAWAVPAGLLHGIINGCIGVGGPVLAMYSLLRKWPKDISLAVINTAAFITMAFVSCNQFRQGLYSSEILELGAWGGIAAGLGSVLGIIAVKRIRPELFKRLMLFMIALSAFMMFFQAFR